MPWKSSYYLFFKHMVCKTYKDINKRWLSDFFLLHNKKQVLLKKVGSTNNRISSLKISVWNLSKAL